MYNSRSCDCTIHVPLKAQSLNNVVPFSGFNVLEYQRPRPAMLKWFLANYDDKRRELSTLLISVD